MQNQKSIQEVKLKSVKQICFFRSLLLSRWLRKNEVNHFLKLNEERVASSKDMGNLIEAVLRLVSIRKAVSSPYQKSRQSEAQRKMQVFGEDEISSMQSAFIEWIADRDNSSRKRIKKDEAEAKQEMVLEAKAEELRQAQPARLYPLVAPLENQR